jgi:hypothetical protein
LKFIFILAKIWLNIPKDYLHFFYNFLWMIATLAANKNSLKKHQYPLFVGGGAGMR